MQWIQIRLNQYSIWRQEVIQLKRCMSKLIGNTKLSINTSLKNDSPSEIKSPSFNESILILVA